MRLSDTCSRSQGTEPRGCNYKETHEKVDNGTLLEQIPDLSLRLQCILFRIYKQTPANSRFSLVPQARDNALARETGEDNYLSALYRGYFYHPCEYTTTDDLFIPFEHAKVSMMNYHRRKKD
jgi:hypothetical protein